MSLIITDKQHEQLKTFKLESKDWHIRRMAQGQTDCMDRWTSPSALLLCNRVHNKLYHLHLHSSSKETQLLKVAFCLAKIVAQWSCGTFLFW